MVVLKRKEKISFSCLSTEETTREAARRRLYAKDAKNTIYVDGAHMLNAPTSQYILSWTKFFLLTIVLFSIIFDKNIADDIIGYIAYFNYGLFCLTILIYVTMLYRRSHVDEESDLVGNITFISLKTAKEAYVFLLSSQLWISIWYFYIFDNTPKICKMPKIKNTEEYVIEKLREFICNIDVANYYIIISIITITLYQIGRFVIIKRL
ncbi:Hypothetical protein SRAE_2000096600 [Strongyloides ratti]|uniref:Uncharacterized protein n=1 Tax=Strongyloides ratti TaxID=34506 RepID=A0A090L945_STRRB|nr:Hypothetical protein SRAE_2000096600 [Strongyloides ratti]CEF66296.1 Hypothetical protein SRAE_2000096600 [Strongyloides ratti]